MPPIDFYMIAPSSPCRAALLTISALGLEVNKKIVNLLAKEQLKPEFVKLNPQHTVPTLDDDGFILWESRAIMAYLVNQYGKDDSLYPKEAKKRAVVDHLLYFDMGTLFMRLRNCYRPVIFDGQTLDPEKEKLVCEAMGWLDGLIGGKKWAAGDQETIADHALAASVSTLEVINVITDINGYPNVKRWFEQCKTELTGYSENETGVKMFGEMFHGALAKVKAP